MGLSLFRKQIDIEPILLLYKKKAAFAKIE